MKAVIFAGGLGTRISEESDLRPKPMVEIGGRPILWHIMKMYSNHGVKDFIICLGYKGYMIKEYFYNYYRHTSDFKINLANGDFEVLNSDSEDWTITFIETGLETQTGGRLKRVQKYVGDETFCLTYGDGLSDVNITKEILFHKAHGKFATVLGVKPPGRFATIETLGSSSVSSFREKHEDEIGWINGGFFVLEPEIFDFIRGDETVWERGPLEELVTRQNLEVFHHQGFWQSMDSLREKRVLEKIFQEGSPPWLTLPPK